LTEGRAHGLNGFRHRDRRDNVGGRQNPHG
jgi:hypothetical protein